MTNGASLVPNIRGLTDPLSRGLEFRRLADIEEQEKAKQTRDQAALEEQIRILTGGAPAAGPGGVPADGAAQAQATGQAAEAALIRIAQLGGAPLANSVRQTLERGDTRELEQNKRMADSAARDALLLKRIKDPVKRQQEITRIAQRQIAAGENPDATIRLANASPLDQENMIESQLVQAADIGSLATDALKPIQAENARTNVGKITQDLRDNLITSEQANALLVNEFKQPEGRQSLQEKLFEQRALALQDQELRFNDPAEKLKFEQVKLNLEAKKAAVQANRETLRKAGNVKQDVNRLVKELLEDKDAIRAAVGPFDQSVFSPTLIGPTLVAETKINQLKSILTAENMDIMTGVLSESDIKIIAAIAGGGLDVGGSDKAFIKELERMEKASAKPSSAPSIQPDVESIAQGRVRVKF